jgi:hypothetical protein
MSPLLFAFLRDAVAFVVFLVALIALMVML